MNINVIFVTKEKAIIVTSVSALSKHSDAAAVLEWLSDWLWKARL